MLGHRLRRWPSIEPALAQRILFALALIYDVIQPGVAGRAWSMNPGQHTIKSDITGQVTRISLLNRGHQCDSAKVIL